ncbi:transcriptional regulator [Shewanella sp. 11B5]|uniref:helix-turn-helix domain-containing protein n=1 Tax=Shewanella TaxID=22 RepID=UPI000C7CFF43|nr:helix-turn-helix transcriptional regulator [Shewanella sp. 11B5]PKH98347.1 transcriptional regulator [Shewanella sp. 11B5]|tara:strand:+ start:141 stop:365 length:225 start_codon:yes stop_codon:yes gene_type:complete
MEDLILVSFGAYFKSLRVSKGLSQEQLALKADLDRTYISGIERGKRNVSLINIVKLAEALELSPKQLLDFKFKE